MRWRKRSMGTIRRAAMPATQRRRNDRRRSRQTGRLSRTIWRAVCSKKPARALDEGRLLAFLRSMTISSRVSSARPNWRSESAPAKVVRWCWRRFEARCASGRRGGSACWPGDRDFAVVQNFSWPMNWSWPTDVRVCDPWEGAGGIREMLGLSDSAASSCPTRPARRDCCAADEAMQNYDLRPLPEVRAGTHARGPGNVLTAALRGYRDLRALSAAREGPAAPTILEASNDACRRHARFATCLRVFVRDCDLAAGTSRRGYRLHLRCRGQPWKGPGRTSQCDAEAGVKPLIVGATGTLCGASDGPLEALPNESVRSLIGRPRAAGCRSNAGDCQVITSRRTRPLPNTSSIWRPTGGWTIGSLGLLLRYSRPTLEGFWQRGP